MPAGCGTWAATEPGETTAVGGRQEIPASRPSSADAAVDPPATPIYRRGGVATRPRWRAFWYLRRARRRQLPCPRPPSPQAKATSRGAVAAPAAEQSRIRATATRGKIGRTRPLTGSETASADRTAPPLTRAWPTGRGATWRSVGKISSSPCAHQDSTSGGSAHATAARTTSCVTGSSTARISSWKGWLPSDTFCSGRGRASGRGPSPPWRRRALLTSIRRRHRLNRARLCLLRPKRRVLRGL